PDPHARGRRGRDALAPPAAARRARPRAHAGMERGGVDGARGAGGVRRSFVRGDPDRPAHAARGAEDARRARLAAERRRVRPRAHPGAVVHHAALGPAARGRGRGAAVPGLLWTTIADLAYRLLGRRYPDGQRIRFRLAVSGVGATVLTAALFGF